MAKVKTKDEKQLTLLDHLAELRKRLAIVLLVNVIAMFVCYQFSDILIKYILNLNPGMSLIYISPSELFLVYIKISIIAAVVVCMPLTVTEIWLFVAKGLYKREKIYIVLSLIAGLFFFVGGVVFCYQVVLPFTLGFFMRITIEDIAPMISVEQFTSFINSMLVAFGVVFEMPVLIALLTKLEILKPKTLVKSHGILILVIFVVAAIITPPDVISQILLAVPMMILLELSIGVSMLVDRSNRKRHAALAAE